jgi:type VII secretion-associated serine protease mycosin
MRPRIATTTLSSALMAAMLVVAPVPAAQAADQVSDGQWFHQVLNTQEAHKLSRGEGVTVAVIDSGVDATHPDLAGSVLAGTDITSEGPGDGRVDTNGHGTMMASLIAAHGRVRGVAPAAAILPVRAGTADGTKSDRVSAGIEWAAAHGARVISISVGGRDDPLKRQVVQAALAADIVIVASAGNLPDDTSVLFPAAYPGVIAAAAVGKNGEHSAISTSGSQVVISAPGEEISGAHPGGKYAIGSGSSNSTAIIAGAVALIRARFPQLKAADVVRRLTATATDKGSPGRDPEYGFGVINLVGALTADLPAASEAPSAAPTRQGSGLGTSPSTPGRQPWVLLLILGGAVVAVLAFTVYALRRRRSATL